MDDWHGVATTNERGGSELVALGHTLRSCFRGSRCSCGACAGVRGGGGGGRVHYFGQRNIIGPEISSWPRNRAWRCLIESGRRRLDDYKVGE